MQSQQTPLISVVMAVYNGERFLKESLTSIFNQTYQNFELILIDDASTDRTSSIIDGFPDQQIDRITNPHNLGQTRSLNIGMKAAKGRYIARHDGDDLSRKDRFQQQVDFLNANTDVGLVSSDYDVIDKNKTLLETISPPQNNMEILERLQTGNVLCHGSVMMRKELLDQVGGYNNSFRVT